MKEGKQPDFRVCPNLRRAQQAEVGILRPAAASRCRTSPSAATTLPPRPRPTKSSQDYGEGPPVGLDLRGLILAGMAFGVYQLAQQPTPAPPPEIFTIGTVAPNLPPAGAAPEKSPGQEDYEQGVLRLNANDPAGAAALFARAASAAPDNHVFRHAYAVALLQSGEKEASIDQYASALRLSPDNTTYRLNYAKALARVGRRNEALAEYEALIDRHPGDMSTCCGTRRGCVMESDPAARARLPAPRGGRAAAGRGAEAAAGLASSTNPETRTPRRGCTPTSSIPSRRAHHARAPGRDPHPARAAGEAVALFRSGLQQFPDVPLLHRGLASALERSGATAEAIAEYREYARLAPNAPDAQQLRERADRLEKQVAAAIPDHRAAWSLRRSWRGPARRRLLGQSLGEVAAKDKERRDKQRKASPGRRTRTATSSRRLCLLPSPRRPRSRRPRRPGGVLRAARRLEGAAVPRPRPPHRPRRGPHPPRRRPRLGHPRPLGRGARGAGGAWRGIAKQRRDALAAPRRWSPT